ncbi:MAG: uncharacterized membrane protein YozB (DUF420 family) [Planctomycetota bacterium]|jgi:uncharacterized membrane protein YozB (DUF420 family)
METLSTIATVLATLAVLCIVAGLVFARNRKKHVPLMFVAFALDIVGLILIEFGPMMLGERDPVSSLSADPGMIKSVHALLATGSLVGYVMQIMSGKKVLNGDRTALPSHIKVAKFFLLTRFGAYITMFMV